MCLGHTLAWCIHQRRKSLNPSHTRSCNMCHIIVTQIAASSLLHHIKAFPLRTISSEHGQEAQSTPELVSDDFPQNRYVVTLLTLMVHFLIIFGIGRTVAL